MQRNEHENSHEKCDIQHADHIRPRATKDHLSPVLPFLHQTRHLVNGTSILEKDNLLSSEHKETREVTQIKKIRTVFYSSMLFSHQIFIPVRVLRERIHRSFRYIRDQAGTVLRLFLRRQDPCRSENTDAKSDHRSDNTDVAHAAPW